MSAPITCGDGRVEIRVGDCRDLLRKMPDESVHCVVTSPPYFGLRDYGVDGQIGLEASPQVFLKVMVEVFQEVRRVLRKDGTAWVNMGDSYCSTGGPGWQGKNGQRSDRRFTGTRNTVGMRHASRGAVAEYKPKDMMGLPWRLAFALQDDGWWLRQDIIWSKPNPMPESTRDRCTKAHEYLFLLSKSPQYHYDQEAIREPASPNTHARMSQDVEAQLGSARANGGSRPSRPMKAVSRKVGRREDGIKSNDSFVSAVQLRTDTRNKRSVWTVASEAFSGAHFATYPPRLIEPCILAGCPKGGVVLDPFGGAGTTGLVAARHRRQAILLELNPEYAEIARRRIDDEWGIREPAPEDASYGPLFGGVCQ